MSESVLAEGSLIGGRYRLQHHLGEGGMGTVWSAVHTVTRRAVAMKFLKDSVRERTELRQRFLREAAAASALKHPNVVEILDVFDFTEASPVMVMELLQGETLGGKLLHDQHLSLEETAALLLPVVSAVGTAHALGIVHRDLKPENLFLVEQSGSPLVKVLDFGIAKLTADHYLARGASALHTDAGSMLGTPYYMAPEQASGESAVDHRADVWSIGVILYECLSGTRPIEGENLTQVVSRLMNAGIIPLERLAPQLPSEVSAVVMQMLARDPLRRPDGLREVSRVLARYSHAAAPEFAEPAAGRASLLPHPPAVSQRPRPKFVSNRGVDPQGPTMISAPPVDSSVNIHKPPARARNRVRVIAVSAVAAASCLTWLALLRTRSLPASDKHAAALVSVAPTAGRVSAPLPLPRASVSAPSGAPAPPASAANGSKAPPLATVASPKARAEGLPTRQLPPHRDNDDDSLFSGRK